MSPDAKFRGWVKTRQPFSSVCGPKVTKFGGMQRSPIVDIMFCCIDMFGQVQSRPKKVFMPPARGGKCPGEFGSNFSNSSHK